MHRKRGSRALAPLWLAAIAWVAVLFFFSGQTGAESGELSMQVTRLLLKLFPWLPWTAEALHPVVRKRAHFGIFAVEGALLSAALMVTLRRKSGLGAALACALCAGMAALNEYHQSFMEGRSCELRDMLIDSGGAVAGALAAALLLWLLRRRARRRNVII